MDMIEIMFMVLVFITVFAVVMLVSMGMSSKDYSARLNTLLGRSDTDVNSESDLVFKVVKIVKPFAKYATPTEGWDDSPLRIQFIQAGWRDPIAPKLFFGLKTFLTLLFPIILFILFRSKFNSDNAMSSMVTLLLIGASVGLVTPKIYLDIKTKKRKQELFESFPDALDLLIICMGAGLSFDQALSRVSTEIKMKSEVLHEEFDLLLLEVRSGFSREKALRNFALRTGVEEIETFASMIIQSERFGTSISDSLRVHSEEFRLKRKQKAEEMAAKIPVKLLFPLVVCMLPTVLFIMVGPSIMQVFKSIK